jgi:hypothetical protein
MTRSLPRLAICLALLTSFTASAATHPSLFLREADLPALRLRSEQPGAAVAWGALQRGATTYLGTTVASSGTVTWTATGRTESLGDTRAIGNMLVVLAFTARMTGDARFLATAKAWTTTVAGWGNLDLDGTHDLIQSHLTGGLAVAYDLLAPHLSAAEITTIRATLTRNANELVAAANGGIWWRSEYLGNHNWVNHAAVGLTALALEGEVAQASTDGWLAFARGNAQKVAAALDQGADGTWHESFAYAWYGLTWHLPFVEALRRLKGVELMDVDWLRAFPRAYAASHVAEAPHVYVLASGDFYGFGRDNGLLPLRYAASRLKSGLAQGMADAWVARAPVSTYAPNLNQRVFEFLFHDPSVPAVAPSTQPLDWFGQDLQASVFRSGWEAGSLVFALKSGPFGGRSAWEWQRDGLAPTGGTLNFGHNHADDNGFYLYGRGSWLAPEASGYYIGHSDSPLPAANMTVFHNSLTIDGQGQVGEGVRNSGDSLHRYAWAYTRQGGISFFGSAADYGYTVGDGSRLYPAALGLQQWDRHALFLDRKYVVLRDVVRASQARTFRWLCHFMNGGTQEGSWLHGRGENGQALGVAVVSPASFTAAFATQSPRNVNQLNPAGSVTLATVAPATAAASTTFLTALVPTAEADWAARPQVSALDAATPDAGLRLVDGAGTHVALFEAAPGQVRRVGSFLLAGQAGVVRYAPGGGAPNRVLLVRGTQLADSSGARVLLSQEATAGMLEADGLQGDTVTLSGGDATGFPRVWAPAATRVRWNGVDVPFTRVGEHVLVNAQPPVVTEPDGGSGGGVDAGTPGGGGTADGGTAKPGTDGGTGPVVEPLTPGEPQQPSRACSAGGSALAPLWLGLGLAALALRRRRHGA